MANEKDPWDDVHIPDGVRNFLKVTDQSIAQHLLGRSMGASELGSYAAAQSADLVRQLIMRKRQLEDYARHVELFSMPVFVTDAITARRLNVYLKAYCINGGSRYWQRRYWFIRHRERAQPKPVHPRFDGCSYWSARFPIDGSRMDGQGIHV